MSNKLRIGVVGAGNNTRNKHIPGFQALDGVQVTVVCNRSEESSRKVADAFNIPRTAAHWREVVEDPEVDAVCIGTWPYLHAEITIAALEAGKHVLTEARMACNLEQAEGMLAVAKKHPQLVAQIVPAPFSFTWDATIVRALQAGELGQLRQLRVIDWSAGAALADTPATWRQRHDLSGCNIMAMGIHYETVQRWLGQRDPQWISAEGAIFTAERKDPESGAMLECVIPESLQVIAAYADGLRLVMDLSSIHSGKRCLELQLHGSSRSLRIDLTDKQAWCARAGESVEDAWEVDPADQGTWQVESDFVASIREGKPVALTGFTDGVRYMRFTQRVWESLHAEGRRTPW